MSFSIESLRCFEAAASRLNFGQAAQQVALSATAFSDRIKRLEQDLGHRLFERNTRKVTLTRQGLHLLPHARQLLIDARRCQTLFDDRRAPVRLTIGTRFELGMSWLVPQLGPLTKSAPHRRVHLAFADGPDLLAQLKSGRIDAMISSMRLATPGLAYASLHEERYVLVGKKNAPKDVVLDIDNELPLFRYFLDAHDWPFRDVECLGTIAAVRYRVLDGAGVAVLPAYFIAGDRRFIQLMPRVRLARDYFRLVWRADHPLQDELSELADALRRAPLR